MSGGHPKIGSRVSRASTPGPVRHDVALALPRTLAGGHNIKFPEIVAPVQLQQKHRSKAPDKHLAFPYDCAHNTYALPCVIFHSHMTTHYTYALPYASSETLPFKDAPPLSSPCVHRRRGRAWRSHASKAPDDALIVLADPQFCALS